MDSLTPMGSCGGALWPLCATGALAEAVAASGRLLRLATGERLFSSGDDAGGLYLVRQGTVIASLPGGESALMSRHAGPGALLGLPAALCSHRYQFDAEAGGTVEAVFLPSAALQQLLRTRPELCLQVMNLMCDELEVLRQTRDQLGRCNHASCGLRGCCLRAIQ